MAARIRTTWQDRSSWLILGLALGLLLLPRAARVRLSQPLETGLLAPLRVTAWLRRSAADLAAENRRLTRLASELAVENARLVSRSGEPPRHPATSLPLVYSPVIGRDLSTLQRFLIISRGTRHGLRTGTCAITAAGVAGRVVAASPGQALVQTILDPDSRIAVTDRRSGTLAVARPEPGRLVLDYAADTADFAVGDTLVTSGLGRVFPRGLRVGVVTALPGPTAGMFRLVEVRPFVDVTRLDGVFVLAAPDAPAPDADDWLDNLAPAEVAIPGEPAP